MKNCATIDECLFYNDNMKKMPSTSEMMKRYYCQLNYDQCARYKVLIKASKEKVPADLFPSDSIRAKIILAAY